jgi:hypothetical protein
MSFHNNMRKAAIATSCDAHSDISSLKNVVEEEEEEGKLDSRIF